MDTDWVDVLFVVWIFSTVVEALVLGPLLFCGADLSRTSLDRLMGLCTCTFLGDGSWLPPELTVDETLKEFAPAIRLMLGTLLLGVPAHGEQASSKARACSTMLGPH